MNGAEGIMLHQRCVMGMTWRSEVEELALGLYVFVVLCWKFVISAVFNKVVL
jgi:hypothetical protein